MIYGYPAHYRQPQAKEAPVVSEFQKAAAQQLTPPATHLSADGSRAYRTRYGVTFEAAWQQGVGCFSAWWPMPEGAEMPEGVVEL